MPAKVQALDPAFSASTIARNVGKVSHTSCNSFALDVFLEKKIMTRKSSLWDKNSVVSPICNRWTPSTTYDVINYWPGNIST